MKKLAMLSMLGLISLTGKAQKVIEKNFEYRNQPIEVDVKFATNIEVHTWEKNEVYFKADLTTEGGRYLDLYKLNLEAGDSGISITSDATPMFKAHQKEEERKNPQGGKYGYTNFKYEFNYILYLPENSECKVSSINGNLQSDRIQGNFTADLINGDIDIKEYSGVLQLSTINGAIDLTLNNTSLTAETLHGNIYADENFSFTSEKRMLGQSISGATQKADNKLRLNTINGNMYLRL